MEVLTRIVPLEDAGERIDKWICAQVEGISRSSAQKFCEEGLVEFAGKPLAKNYKLKGGEELVLTIPDPVELDVAPEDIPLDIVYEDSDLLVVNKPKGMVVHPAYGNLNHTLVNALLYHCKGQLSGINGVIRPGIVHRIDKDTSGLLVVAKNDMAHQSLAAQIKEHSFDRFYHAIVYGNIKEDSGTVNQPIGRHPSDRKRMAVTDKNSRNAVTHFEVLERYDGFTHLRLKLETGRTHQIRVHMAYIGHPLAGDPVYGPRKVITSLEGQCLHARTIAFVHPKTGEFCSFDSPLPPYFTKFLSSLKRC